MTYRCPICKRDAKKSHHPKGGDAWMIDCPRCGGAFEIGGSPCDTLEKQNEHRYLLSGVLRHKFERNEPVPLIGQDCGNGLAEQAPPSAEAKVRKLLEVIAMRAPNPGDDEAVLTHDTDYPLAYAKGVDGLRSFLDDLSKKEWIKVKHSDESQTRCSLTVAGRTEIEQTAAAVG
jgi:hypothetical protein